MLCVQFHVLCSRPDVVEATAALVAAAKRVLPQQKRNQLVKQQRTAAVAASRASRKQAGAPFEAST
jgi:hypothetical protein